MLESQLNALEPWVIGPRNSERPAEVVKKLVRWACDTGLLPIRTGVDARRREVLAAVARARRGLVGEEEPAEAGALGMNERVEERDIDALAAAAARTLVEGSESA